jgi:nitroimidazol reductase NimA-like FMN-containing flavoprotein (pyridoxamine 5'-phosphate oxidase superfamily)
MLDTLSSVLTVRRHPERAVEERAAALAVLDEALVCHVGFSEGGRPWVIPTTFGRDRDLLYLHGSPLSRMLQTLAGGVELCVTVTLLDGLVLARSAFAHSMNYRSVVVIGRATEVSEPAAKLEAMRCIVEHVLPGRWSEVRPPTRKEVESTLVLALPLDHLSAKARSGPPLDPARDRALPVWAGEVPLRRSYDAPRADTRLSHGTKVPMSVSTARAGATP